MTDASQTRHKCKQKDKNPYLITLGPASAHSFTDCYICDRENTAEYTIVNCVVQIYNHKYHLDISSKRNG